ncbi:MAG: lysophospholipid acyltransferase family protein [Actinomycetota bacterium]|nr:lysophospholipid acyltransferase family protein [Actinomycetota bacterium]
MRQMTADGLERPSSDVLDRPDDTEPDTATTSATATAPVRGVDAEPGQGPRNGLVDTELDTAPTGPEERGEPPSGAIGVLSPVARAMIRPACHLYNKLTVEGLENVPATGRAIIAANHISFLDSVVLLGTLPRRVTFVGKAEYLDSWTTRYLFPAIGMIPIDRSGGRSALRALEQACEVLERDELFGIFPEGTRSRDGLLHRGRTGIARVAMRTGAVVVPTGIVGTAEIQPPGAKVPRPRRECRVHFGEPIDPARYESSEPDPLVHRRFTDEIMYEIRQLSGQRYVDTYA